MKLIVGLGNPGPKYEGTRHNIGFMAIDRWAALLGHPAFREKFKGLFAKVVFGGEDLVLLKPQTFMNLSGESVQAAMTFFKADLKDVIVVHDELDLPFGTLRVKQGGGAAGHNGLKSITRHGGGDGYVRVRMGIGRPPSGRTEGYVLSQFPASDRAELPDVLDETARILECIVREGALEAMNKFHGTSRNDAKKGP